MRCYVTLATQYEHGLLNLPRSFGLCVKHFQRAARQGHATAISHLADLLMRCLAKQPEQRPPSAEALDQALAACASAGSWTLADAEQWWRANMAAVEALPAATMAEKTLVIAPRP